VVHELIENYQPDDGFEEKNKEIILEYLVFSPNDALTRGSRIAHLTVSAFILNETMDKALMVHHNLYKTWAWPGGHADGNPDLLQVAYEEAREETGVKNLRPLSEGIMSLDILPVFKHTKGGEAVASHLHFNASFIFVAGESQQLMAKEDENSGVAWLEVGKLAQYCREPHIEPIYEKLIKKAWHLTSLCKSGIINVK